MQAVVILQARMASFRLPGKVLARIGSRTLLGHCLERLRMGSATPVLLATTTNAEDDRLAETARSHGVHVFRGPDRDVLARYVLAARSVGARYVVRATADNPAVDIGGTERVLSALRSSRADYVVETGLPYGANVEAVTFDALCRAEALAGDGPDREHVTTLIRRDRTRFAPVEIPAPLDLQRPAIRLTVDTEGDLIFMRQIAARLAGWSAEPDLRTIIEVADAIAVERRCA